MARSRQLYAGARLPRGRRSTLAATDAVALGVLLLMVFSIGACKIADDAMQDTATATPSTPIPPPAPGPPPPAPRPPQPSGAQITIDPGQTFQTMSGWEVSARLWEQNKSENRYDPTWLTYRDEILDRIVNEVGIDRIRIEVRSGFENPVDHWARFVAGIESYTDWRQFRYEKINDNDDPDSADPAGFQFSELDYQIQNIVLPMQALLQARGERLFINLCYVDFRPDASSGNVEHALDPDEYAELILVAFDHLRTRWGIEPDAFEVILEPELTDHWRGANIGAALVAAGARLQSAGYQPEFAAPSTTAAGSAPGYIDAMMSVPGAASFVTTFSYHSYDGPSDSVRRAIRSRAEQYGATTGMLEHLGADAAELERDLVEADVTAWQQFGLAYSDTPGRDAQGAYLLLVDPARPAGQEVRLATRTRELAQYFRHVRAGATRIAVSTGSGAHHPVAFVNADGRPVVVIRTDTAGDFTIHGLPAGRYGVQYSSSRDLSRDLADVTIAAGDPLVSSMPDRGVVTVHQR